MSTEVYIYLFITAVIFTIVGYREGVKKVADSTRMAIIAATIEGLIKDGYIATAIVNGVDDIVTIEEHDKAN
jgi:hypothetical protein